MLVKFSNVRLIWLFCLFPLFVAGISHAQGICDASRLPARASKLLESKYRGWRIETLADLGDRYSKMWLEKHERDCPGLASGYLRGEGNVESYVVLLLPRDIKNQGFKVVELSQTRDGILSSNVLESWTGRTNTPVVVSRVAPGQYFNAARWRKVQINTDSIFVEELEVAGRLYYWKEGRFARIMTSY